MHSPLNFHLQIKKMSSLCIQQMASARSLLKTKNGIKHEPYYICIMQYSLDTIKAHFEIQSL